MILKAYKVKDVSTGKFSTGGMSPRWTNRGKTWSQLNHVKTHLRQFCKDYIFGRDYNGKDNYREGWWNNIPENWVVVEISSEGVKEYSAKELYPATSGENI